MFANLRPELVAELNISLGLAALLVNRSFHFLRLSLPKANIAFIPQQSCQKLEDKKTDQGSEAHAIDPAI